MRSKSSLILRYFRVFAVLAVVLQAAISVGVRAADTPAIPAAIRVDHRGLIEIPGVLRANSGHHWGAMNLVLMGPSWGYAAQDYALKNIQRSGKGNDLTITGDMAVPGTAVSLREVTKNVKRQDGSSALRVEMTLRAAQEGKPMGLQRAYVFFPLAVLDFEGCTIESDSGVTATLPATPGAEFLAFPREVKSVSITGKSSKDKPVTFRLTGSKLLIAVVDGRKQDANNTRYEIRVEFPNAKEASSSEIAFEVSASYPPFMTQADENWVPFPYENTIKSGSILDFSFLNADTAPAGKEGRIIVGPDGHFTHEQTGKRVKFSGVNLCFTANFVDKKEADQLAQSLRTFGYNAVRFHHTDVMIMQGGWNSWNKHERVTYDPAQLDRLDYLFAAMKKAGLYVTIDLYAMGCFAKGEIEGIDTPIYGEIKALVPIYQPAFDAWGRRALEWLNHTNRYTGLTWKEDPALLSICPLNEDSIASVWWGAKARYEAGFAEWKARQSHLEGRTDGQLLARFLTETKAESNRRIAAFLRANGVKALISGCNWWDTMAQTFERDTLDVVDNHQYSDHPQSIQSPSRYNQKSNLREGNPTYMTPIFMAATRIPGKPFTVTEINYCAPNQYRAEGGALMGAYTALQDWDALFRFAWAHDAGLLRVQHAMSGFDVSTDPLNQMTERQVLLMFRRGDVAAGRKTYGYAVTMAEATQQGVGDMWAKGIFPHEFNALALVSQIGSQVAEGDRRMQGKYTAVVAAQPPVKPEVLSSNTFLLKGEIPVPAKGSPIRSDTGEITLDNQHGWMTVAAPQTCCIVAPSGAALEAGVLSVDRIDTFCSVSASAMDARALGESRRILLFHLTNVLNSRMLFADPSMTLLHDWGRLPYLARTGTAHVTLKNSTPGLVLYAVASDGSRMGRRATTYANGAYTFTLAVSAADQPHPTMIYELAEK